MTHRRNLLGDGTEFGGTCEEVRRPDSTNDCKRADWRLMALLFLLIDETHRRCGLPTPASRHHRYLIMPQAVASRMFLAATSLDLELNFLTRGAFASSRDEIQGSLDARMEARNNASRSGSPKSKTAGFSTSCSSHHWVLASHLCEGLPKRPKSILDDIIGRLHSLALRICLPTPAVSRRTVADNPFCAHGIFTSGAKRIRFRRIPFCRPPHHSGSQATYRPRGCYFRVFG